MLRYLCNNKINRNKIKKMKKTKQLTLATFLLTCLAFNASNAQDIKSSTAAFGFKGGLNFSNLYTDNVDDNNVLTGFNAGLYAKFPITNSVSIQPEISYTTKGAELSYNNAFANGTATFKTNYIEVPVLLFQPYKCTYMLDHMQLTW
jgi:hypothetical protein